MTSPRRQQRALQSLRSCRTPQTPQLCRVSDDRVTLTGRHRTATAPNTANGLRLPTPPEGCSSVHPARWAAQATTQFLPEEAQGFNGFRSRLQLFLESLGGDSLDEKWEAAGRYLESYQDEAVASRTVERLRNMMAQPGEGGSSPALTVTLVCMLFSLVSVYNKQVADVVAEVQRRLLTLIYVVPPPVPTAGACTGDDDGGYWEDVQDNAGGKTHSQALRQLWVKKTDTSIDLLTEGIKTKQARALGIRRALERWQNEAKREVLRSWRATVRMQKQQKSVQQRLQELQTRCTRLQARIHTSEEARSKLEAELVRMKRLSSLTILQDQVATLQKENEGLEQARDAINVTLAQTGVTVTRCSSLGHTSHERKLREMYIKAGSPLSWLEACVGSHALGKGLPPATEVGFAFPSILCHIALLMRFCAPRLIQKAGVEALLQVEEGRFVGDLQEVGRAVVAYLGKTTIGVPAACEEVLAEEGEDGAAARSLVVTSVALRVVVGCGAQQVPFDEEGLVGGWFTNKVARHASDWTSHLNDSLAAEQRYRQEVSHLTSHLVELIAMRRMPG